MDRVNELIKRVRLLRPIDDVMFKKLAESREVCQEILRVILDDKKLIVEEVISEDSIANIFGRAVRLDALCILGNGTMCNIEIQKENVNDDVRRVRYNASSIVSRFSEKGLIFSSDILRIKSEAVSVPLCGTRGSYIHVKKNFIFTFRRTSL